MSAIRATRSEQQERRPEPNDLGPCAPSAQLETEGDATGVSITCGCRGCVAGRGVGGFEPRRSQREAASNCGARLQQRRNPRKHEGLESTATGIRSRPVESEPRGIYLQIPEFWLDGNRCCRAYDRPRSGSTVARPWHSKLGVIAVPGGAVGGGLASMAGVAPLSGLRDVCGAGSRVGAPPNTRCLAASTRQAAGIYLSVEGVDSRMREAIRDAARQACDDACRTVAQARSARVRSAAARENRARRRPLVASPLAKPS